MRVLLGTAELNALCDRYGFASDDRPVLFSTYQKRQAGL
jgi:hypothetical protein